MKKRKFNGTPRMSDVAKDAGVSVPTASLILADKGDRYNPETRRKVLASAKKLGWRPNALVKGIQSGETRMIGVLVPPYDSYWTQVLAGIHSTLAQNNYVPITLWIGENENNFFHSEATDDGLQQIYRLIDRRVEGFILWPVVAATYAKHFQEWIDRNLPAVIIDAELPGGVADSVETDESVGAQMIAEHLGSLGHRRIAVLSRSSRDFEEWSHQRTAAAVAAFKRLGMVCRVWSSGESADEISAAARDILSGDFKPTAVFCITDYIASVFYSAAADMKISIPDQISVVGCADLQGSVSMRPPLTTVRQKPLEIGQTAAQLLLDRIRIRNPAETQRVRIGCELMVRGSTAAVK